MRIPTPLRSTRAHVLATVLAASAAIATACGPSADAPFTVPGSIAAPPGLVDPGRLTIAVPDDLPPYAFNGKGGLQGFDVDLATQMARLMNLTPRFVTVPAGQLLDGARSASVDVAAGLIPVPRGAVPSGALLVPYLMGGTELVVRSGAAFEPEQLTDLCGRHVAVVEGTRQDTLTTQLVAQCAPVPLSITRVRTDGAAVAALRDGSADAYVADSGTAAFDKARDDRLLTSSGELDTVEMAVALPDNGTPSSDALRSDLDLLRADGSYEVLLLKWGLEKQTL